MTLRQVKIWKAEIRELKAQMHEAERLASQPYEEKIDALYKKIKVYLDERDAIMEKETPTPKESFFEAWAKAIKQM